MSTTYGYCRVSTTRQKLNRHIDTIREYDPDAVIVTEKFTGTTQERPVWQRLKSTVREGDTIVFDDISRMSRTAAEGFEEYKQLYPCDKMNGNLLDITSKGTRILIEQLNHLS